MFDYNNDTKIWETVSTYDEAVRVIHKRFHEYWLEDRDDFYTYVIELFHNDKYEVWFSECGSWFYYDDDGGPCHDIYCGDRNTDKDFNFTKLNPTKDYIII